MAKVLGVSLLPGRVEWRRRPRLVAIDVDHTLIRDDHTLADATIDAVRDVREAGVQVVLASSRPPGGMRQFVQALDLLEPAVFVAFQGAFVGGCDDDGTLHALATSPIALGTAVQAAEAARSVGMVANWYTADGWFVDRLTDAVTTEARIVGMVPDVVAELSALPAPLKLLFIAEEAGQIDELRPLLPDSVSAEISNPTYFEITAAGVDKATGVRVAAARAGIRLSESVAIGDGCTGGVHDVL